MEVLRNNMHSWERVMCKRTTASHNNHYANNKNQKPIDMVCKFWANGNCFKGDRCRFLHSWFRGDDISIIANLQGHNKAVTGIAFPSEGDKLYSGSKDGTLRVWNCHTAQCERVINLGAEVGCLINEGSWIFVGLPNVVKAWNIQNGAEFSLDGPKGQVYTLAFEDNILFAGTQSGQILAWKLMSPESGYTNPFQAANIPLEGHTHGVVCFSIGSKRLYSGSMDGTIKVTDIGTLKCVMSLKGHSNAVMSLICWANCLISCSLDGTIRAWHQPQQADLLELCYTHQEKQGILALSGMNIPGKTPEGATRDVLFVSCDDNSVHLYELPSFEDKGRVFTKQQVRALQVQDGHGGLFFAGDGTGRITVGKLAC